MDQPLSAPDAGRELRDLRARAYGPDADIQDDPAALARLAELEARHARAAAPPEVEESAPTDAAHIDLGEGEVIDVRPSPASESSPREAAGDSRLRQLTSSRSGRIWLGAAAGIAIVAIAYGVTWAFGPHPDATLWPTTVEPDTQVLSLMLDADIDLSTLEAYEPFHGVEPWFAVDDYGSPCLMIVERSTNALLEAHCTPREAELFADIGAWPAVDADFAEGMPDGSIIRFHYRGNAVDAFVHPARETD